MRRFKLDILGTTYTVSVGVDPAKDDGLDDRFGYCSQINRQIVIADLLKIDGWKDEPAFTRERLNRQTLRHEIIHAFFYESGLWGNSFHDIGPWALNEEMTDWLAIQWPKIQDAFVQAGAV